MPSSVKLEGTAEVVVEVADVVEVVGEVIVEVWLEKVLKINFHGWVGGEGGLDEVGIRLSQLSTKLKLKLKLKLSLAKTQCQYIRKQVYL